MITTLENIHTLVFDFDGVFTDNKVYLNQDGVETVCCDRRDGLGIDILRWMQETNQLKLDTFILSTEINAIVAARAKKLRLTCHQNVRQKLPFLQQYFSEKRPSNPNPFDGLIYLGNDLNDLPVINVAGYSVAPLDAHPYVKERVNLVLPEKGGDGFIRAFVELLLDILKLDLGEISEHIFNSGNRN